MGFKTAFSTNPNPELAAREVAAGLACERPRLVVFFASPALEPEALGRALRRELGAVPSIGCTSAGEITTGRMLKRSLVVGVFDEDDLASAVLSEVRDASSEASAAAALTQLAAGAGCAPADLDPQKRVGIVLHDGLSGGEERVMGVLSQRTNVPFVGGSAGDDLTFTRTQVFLDFVPRSGGSILALLEPKRKFSVVKTQSFDVLDKTLKVTSADEAARTVHEFNGRPAAHEYASALGVDVAELPQHFQSHPIGLVTAHGEPFVRSPQQIKGQSVVFYCRVEQGAELSLLNSRDIVADTRRDLAAALEAQGTPSALLNFHCILRTLELEQRNLTDAYAGLFHSLPTLGFSTYGESYVGHMNQTSTMLLFT